MSVTKINGANINYEVVGDRGPWVALSPGGRRDLEGVRYLAEPIAAAGFRVLLHDRRNCGGSDVLLVSDLGENEVWADDLAALLAELGAAPAFVGGSSAGCRLALVTAIRHPGAVRGLLLWRVSGGHYAAENLAQNYYGQFLEAARQDGMAGVAATEHFSERIAQNPANRERILNTDLGRFRETFGRWNKALRDSGDLPAIGATEAELRGITAPAIVIPGNDQTHVRAVGEKAASLIPHAELHVLFQEQLGPGVAPPADQFEAITDVHARLFVDFMNRCLAPA